MTDKTDDEQLLHRLFEQTKQHFETRLEYFSLNATEKASTLAAGIAGAATIFVFAGLVLLFFSLGFGWWLGDLIANRAGGFAFAGLVFVPIGFLFYRWIGPFVRRKVIESMLNAEPFFEKTIDPENPTEHG